MSPRRVFVVAWVLLSLASALWSFATPIGASPDEPAHLIKAASVVRGQFVGVATEQGHVVQVPAYIAFTHAQTCYAFNGNVTADCIPELEGDPAQLVDATTTAGLYNPLYYLVVGWPSLVFADESGIFAIRVASGVFTSLFLAVAIALVSTWARRVLPLLGIVLAITPMVLFLSGTANPNGVETTATLAVFVGMLSIVRHPDFSSLRLRSIVVLVAAAVVANARGLSLAWLAIAILTPLVLLSGPRLRELLRSRIVQVTIAGVFLAVLFAGIWLLASNSLGAAIIDEGEEVRVPYQGSSPLLGFALVLERTFGLAVNMIGIFGWLDAPVPLAVQFVWAATTGALLLLGAVLLRGRARIVAIILVLGVVLLPAVFQGAYIQGGGYIWQGRYTLPAFVCLLVGLAALIADELGDGLTRDRANRLAVTVLVVWAIAQLYAFVTALKRYAVGDSNTWVDLLRDPAWEPPGGLATLIAGFAVVVAALACGGILLARSARLVPAHQDPQGDDTGEQAGARSGEGRQHES